MITDKRQAIGLGALAIYVSAIVLANWAITRYGLVSVGGDNPAAVPDELTYRAAATALAEARATLAARLDVNGRRRR